jgi:hypothetical protein
VREYIPLGPNRHFLQDIEVGRAGLTLSSSSTQKAGSALALSRYLVCAKCNNGWMSRLQERAKPFLVQLFKGSRTALGDEAQSAIAAWATMVTMTAEFMLGSAGKIGALPEHRTQLMQSEAAIPGWKIWIGYYRGGTWNHQWSHTSLPLIGGEELRGAGDVYSPFPNTQTTTFVVGELCIHTMSSFHQDIVRDWHWLEHGRLCHLLAPIWPIRHELIAWPIHGLSDADVALSAGMFMRACESAVRGTGF